MLSSMTGYGEGRARTDAFEVSVEVKGVNNKFLKITSKVPEEISYLQNEIEPPIRERLRRGSIYVTIQFEPASNAELYHVDEPLLRKYAETAERLQKDLDSSVPLRAVDFMSLPGVINAESRDELSRDQVLPVALKALAAALERVSAMRRVEGGALESEFLERTGVLAKTVQEIRTMYPIVLEQNYQRLTERINRLLNDSETSLSEDDLRKEIAVLGERADISEELSRMESHISQFRDSLATPEPVGRKLEFIVQEMFRECNTMGSKSVDSSLNKLVVDLKADVTRLKEQVLNVE